MSSLLASNRRPLPTDASFGGDDDDDDVDSLRTFPQSTWSSISNDANDSQCCWPKRMQKWHRLAETEENRKIINWKTKYKSTVAYWKHC